MNTNYRPGASQPWHRHPWVWFLIAIPLSAVIVGAVMLWLAISSEDGLVVDDYDKHGKEINRVLARDDAARTRGIASQLEFDYARRAVALRLMSETDYQLPDRVQLRLLHPTRSGMDHVIQLTRAPDNRYHGPLPELAEARWHVLVAADDWRLVGSLQAPQFAMIQLAAPPARDD